MRRGLSDILATEVLLFVWDQCVLTSFDLVIPYAAACILALLDQPLQFFLCRTMRIRKCTKHYKIRKGPAID